MAELLIVVAIIAVLVAVAIPVFSGQLEKSRESVDAANIRSQYAQVMSEAIAASNDVNVGGDAFGKINITQAQDGWQNSALEESIGSLFAKVVGSPAKAAQAWVEYSGGKTSLRFSTAGTDPYSIDNHNDPNVTYTYGGWNTGNLDEQKTVTFSTAVMSGRPMWIQNMLRDQLGDPSLVVTGTNLGSHTNYVGEELAKDLAKTFAGTSEYDKSYDKILTIKGSSGTYQYYYKKTSSNKATLYAIRIVTADMVDSSGKIIHTPMKDTDNNDGWVAYTGPLNPAGV